MIEKQNVIYLTQTQDLDELVKDHQVDTKAKREMSPLYLSPEEEASMYHQLMNL